MGTEIIRWQTPEEKEVAKKQLELASIETELAQRELDLTTLRTELGAFEREYLRVVGSCYADLDALEAQIAAIFAKRNPADITAQQTANEAQDRARDSTNEANKHLSQPSKPEFKPTEDIKKLYREAAKRVHPDLANDEADRAKRHLLMAEVNRAYEEGNTERLHEILDEQCNPADIDTLSGVAGTLIHLIRKIAQAEERMEQIGVEIAALEQSDLYQLRQRAKTLQAYGRSLLTEMAADVQRKTTASRSKLTELTNGE